MTANNPLQSGKLEISSSLRASKIIASLLRSKSSFGHDGMSTQFLKTIAQVLLRPLTLIINQSSMTGIFPDQLKIAKVLPVHKKDETTAMDVYRPISLGTYYQLYLKFLKRQLIFNYLIILLKINCFIIGNTGFVNTTQLN